MSTLETFSSAFTSCVSRVRLVVILVAVLLVPHFGQSGQDGELPELVAKRKAVTRAIERASVPALSDYAKKLSPLKEQFARNRQLEAALCVERELKKVGDAITAANSTGERRSKTSDGPQLSDPPELTAKRMEHLRAVQKLSIPFLNSYVQELGPIKSEYTKNGNLEAALLVDREIKKVTKDIADANATASGAVRTTKPPLELISVVFEGPEAGQTADVTSKVRAAIEAGEKSIDCTKAGLGTDPAPYKNKTTTFKWSVNGVLKKKTFKHGATVEFEKDLK